MDDMIEKLVEDARAVEKVSTDSPVDAMLWLRINNSIRTSAGGKDDGKGKTGIVAIRRNGGSM